MWKNILSQGSIKVWEVVEDTYGTPILLAIKYQETSWGWAVPSSGQNYTYPALIRSLYTLIELQGFDLENLYPLSPVEISKSQ